jgi:riboflavin kinase/FMN adenylyltransferase
MKVVSGLPDAAAAKPCVLTIGNFDGLHLGHQFILRSVVEHARELEIEGAVLTFDPHPVKVLFPENAPRMISTTSQKLRLMETTGIDAVYTARFDDHFASLTPDAFIRRYLVEGLRAKVLCVGSNFTFGHRQEGTIETLRSWRHAFDVIEIPPILARGAVVSSTQVRQHIQEGRVSRACRLLGRWFEIEGRIVEGAGRGRHLAVPTLNLEPENELVPQRGVYITRIALDSGYFTDSITNVGVRPTFGKGGQTIETFALHTQVPGGARAACLQFLKRVRDERKFDSPELLQKQIGLDIQTAERYFRRLQARAHA